MVEKIGPIKNPLTIIAIFAAIAEISGTVVLPFIATANQATYVWFLIIFPILLIVMFFLTLNLNHKVLYAPSDYQNEDNFLHSLPRATAAEKVLKIEAEFGEIDANLRGEAEPQSTTIHSIITSDVSRNTDPPSFQSLFSRSVPAKHIFAEELIFRRLSKEFSTEIQRDVKLGSLSDSYFFDGIVRDKGVTTVVEVKFLREGKLSEMQLKETFSRINETVKFLPNEQATNLRVLLVIASDDNSFNQESIGEQIDSYRNELSFPVEVRFYNLARLALADGF